MPQGPGFGLPALGFGLPRAWRVRAAPRLPRMREKKAKSEGGPDSYPEYRTPNRASIAPTRHLLARRLLPRLRARVAHGCGCVRRPRGDGARQSAGAWPASAGSSAGGAGSPAERSIPCSRALRSLRASARRALRFAPPRNQPAPRAERRRPSVALLGATGGQDAARASRSSYARRPSLPGQASCWRALSRPSSRRPGNGRHLGGRLRRRHRSTLRHGRHARDEPRNLAPFQHRPRRGLCRGHVAAWQSELSLSPPALAGAAARSLRRKERAAFSSFRRRRRSAAAG